MNGFQKGAFQAGAFQGAFKAVKDAFVGFIVNVGRMMSR